ncbi:glycosyltransferase [bacterium]|nr:glycosyltransferase [bacterium]
MLQKNAKTTVLHVVDEWDGFTALSHSIKSEIAKCYLSADTVVFASNTLRDQFNSRLGQRSNVVVLPHGLGFDPEEYVMQGLKNRLKHFDDNNISIGYYGAFSKLDLGLIVKVANLLPALKFELAGPIDDLKNNSDYAKYSSKIANTNNIIFIGTLAHVDIPNFVVDVTCLWFPFKINILTEKMSPIKLYEGLSLGVPIVSTKLEGVREIAKDCILYAVTLDQHINCIEAACTAQSAQASAVNSYEFDIKSWKKISEDFLKEIKKC